MSFQSESRFRSDTDVIGRRFQTLRQTRRHHKRGVCRDTRSGYKYGRQLLLINNIRPDCRKRTAAVLKHVCANIIIPAIIVIIIIIINTSERAPLTHHFARTRSDRIVHKTAAAGLVRK